MSAGDSLAGLALRPVTDFDLPALAALERLCFPEPWSSEELGTYFGSGAIVGYVPARRPLEAYAIAQLLPGESELLRIGVSPGARGRGLGAALLRATLAELAASGRWVCHLEVREGNEAARRLYERLDFRLARRRRRYYSDGEDALVYRRDPALFPG